MSRQEPIYDKYLIANNDRIIKFFWINYARDKRYEKKRLQKKHIVVMLKRSKRFKMIRRRRMEKLQ